MSRPSAQVSKPAGLGEQPSSRVWPQRQGMKAQALGVRSLRRNLSPLQPWNSLWVGVTTLALGVCA